MATSDALTLGRIAYDEMQRQLKMRGHGPLMVGVCVSNQPAKIVEMTWETMDLEAKLKWQAVAVAVLRHEGVA